MPGVVGKQPRPGTGAAQEPCPGVPADSALLLA
jgi:hypothetical protein